MMIGRSQISLNESRLQGEQNGVCFNKIKLHQFIAVDFIWFDVTENRSAWAMDPEESQITVESDYISSK